MKLPLLSGIASVLFSFFSMEAQEQTSFCGTSVSDQKQMLTHQAAIKNLPENGDLLYLPIQVHNVATDEGTGLYSIYNLYESLCTLNEDFLPSKIQFYFLNEINEILSTRYNVHEEFEVGEEMMRRNNIPNVINCYLVANPAGNCGYYSYRSDGIALGKACMGRQAHTWTHEMGHFLSLPHPFIGWEGITYNSSKPTYDYQNVVTTLIENTDRDNCQNQADKFCDTHPDYLSARWSCNASFESNQIQKDFFNNSFRSDGSLFMSYASDGCMSRFSDEQIQEMRVHIQGRRAGMLNSKINFIAIEKPSSTAIFPVEASTVPYKSITIRWEKLTGADQYIFQLSRFPGFSLFERYEILNQSFITIDSLYPGKKYFWRVKAINKFEFCHKADLLNTFFTESLSTASEDLIETNITISPNPIKVGHELFVSYGSDDIIQIELLNIKGTGIVNLNLAHVNNATLTQIPFHTIPGIYILKIKTKASTSYRKLLVD
ncbi:MAG: zinc-dependent metalloprotease [Bacteroidota bacterium]|nr:zinc-dependent metalloprotease [Bacteroidota bacterium]